MTTVDSLAALCGLVWSRMRAGKVIPFLGAGANLCDRPEGVDWRRDRYLPSGSELAAYLAEEHEYPAEEAKDLVRVSQYVELFRGGEGVLFESLRSLFAADYRPNKLHHFLAEVPSRLRGGNCEHPCQLIVTTNYDDALERAFEEAGEPFDLVYYAAKDNEPGRLLHRDPSGKRTPLRKNDRRFELGSRTVILKIHGAVDRRDELADSYVITEDHYIDYVALTNVSSLIPSVLMAKMRTSHFLFLGYGMRDWNLRVILHQIWSQQARRLDSWAIERHPDPIDEKFWQRHGVDIVAVSLEEWVDAMRAQMA